MKTKETVERTITEFIMLEIYDITEKLYNLIDSNSILEFKSVYSSFKHLTKSWSIITRCGYIDTEIEEYYLKITKK